MTVSVQGDATVGTAEAAPENAATAGRLRWGIALPVILGLSAALWVGIWFGAKAIIG